MSTITVFPPDPLNHDVPIVDSKGIPTLQFSQQWLKSRKVAVAIDGTAAAAATTLEGYGITDAYTKVESDAAYAPIVHTHSFASLTAKPTTLVGYGIVDAAPLVHTHTAADVTTGVFLPARLATGSPDGTKFLRDDGTWAAVVAGAHVHAATDITSGTLASARLAGAYTGITGLGTLTALTVSGAITLTGTGVVITRTGATTSRIVNYFENTSGALMFGQDGTTVSIVGGVAYDSFWRSKTGISFSADEGTTLHGRITSAGVLDWKGAMTLVGALNGQTISSAANFTGSLTVAGVLTIGSMSTLTLSGSDYILSRSGASTSRQLGWFANTSGDFAWGVEGSVGGTSITGSFAYDALLRGKTGFSISANDGAALHGRITSVGLLDWKGAVTVAGNLTVSGTTTIGSLVSLAVTGIVTIGDSISLTGTGGAGGVIIGRYGATTSRILFQLANTSGGLSVGIEGSIAGGTITGSAAYDAVFRGQSGISISGDDGYTLHGRVTSAGVFAWVGNATVGGTLVVAGTITGTLATVAQPNITSVGTLTSLTISGTLTNNTHTSAAAANLALNAPTGQSVLTTINSVTVVTVAAALITLGVATKVVGAFACNNKTAQTAVTANAEVVGGTGVAAGGFSSAAVRNNFIALVNQIRTTLIANGIMA